MQRADKTIDVTHSGVAIVPISEANRGSVLEALAADASEQQGREMVIIEYEGEDGSVYTAVVQ